MPQVFQGGWSPQIMPACNMILPNDFANPNMGAMGGGYPGM